MHFYNRIVGILIICVLCILTLFWKVVFRSPHTPNKDVREKTSHRLAVIVPFRDRFNQLLLFLPYMHSFLNNQSVHHEFYIINQVDQLRFNRASLVNVGVLESGSSTDYIVIHDVDLLPKNPLLRYTCPDLAPLHLSPPSLHPIYHYAKYLGGILLLTRAHFTSVNGMSNVFWGWGREDDEFRLRLMEKGLQPNIPQGISTGYQTFLHYHPKSAKRDQNLYYNQNKLTFRRDFSTGLNTVAYKLQNRHKISVNSVSATVLNIELICDETVTPYCRIPQT